MQSVQKQVDHKLTAAKAATKTKEQIATEEAKKIKAAAAAAEKELQALLRSTVKQPKLEPGVDPKSVVCEFFKAGVCEKGACVCGENVRAVARRNRAALASRMPRTLRVTTRRPAATSRPTRAALQATSASSATT